MEGSTVDPEHEERAPLVMRAAERQLGEDRFGGAWIDRTAPSRPVIGVAAVDPSQGDVDAIDAVARETGWPVQIVAVRYSRAELVGLLESLDKTPLPGDAWVSLGWDPLGCFRLLAFDPPSLAPGARGQEMDVQADGPPADPPGACGAHHRYCQGLLGLGLLQDQGGAPRPRDPRRGLLYPPDPSPGRGSSGPAPGRTELG
jgi:hypothetical protein